MDSHCFSQLVRDAEPESPEYLLTGPTLSLIRDIKEAARLNALDVFLQNNALKPAQTQRHIDEASILARQGFLRTAELLFASILKLNPASEEAFLRLAGLNEIEGRFSKTIAYARDLKSIGIYNKEITYQLAFALYKLGRHDEALEEILPLHIQKTQSRVDRLCALILKSLGKWEDAIQVLEKVVAEFPRDAHSIRALSRSYSDLGFYQKALETILLIPDDLTEDDDKICEVQVLRLMGELELAIKLNREIIAANPKLANAHWTQCFNYSIANARHGLELVNTSRQYWQIQRETSPRLPSINLNRGFRSGKRIRIAFLSSDIGEHVVSRFLSPLLRYYDRDKYHVTLLSSHRRFEEKGAEIATYADAAISLQGMNIAEIYSCIEKTKVNIIIETNGFTANSGIGVLARRCAPVQCHYIGYHATTGLDTIDYFLGDTVTVPDEFQPYYSEKLVQLPTPWIAYDSTICFPTAATTAQRASPVLGSFSQVTKINRFTLDYWATALNAVPDSILVIKDRGCYCSTSRQRIEDTLQSLGIDPGRVYFIGPVPTHFDHLDSYNAIDIALDTTPWSSATTAFEALGMGVPLVAIWGDTTSGRMSSSVVSAAGMCDLIAHSKEEFAQIVSQLAKEYKQVRNEKTAMQKRIRSGILFDEQRICRDFYETIDRLVANHASSNQG